MLGPLTPKMPQNSPCSSAAFRCGDSPLTLHFSRHPLCTSNWLSKFTSNCSPGRTQPIQIQPQIFLMAIVALCCSTNPRMLKVI
jgi:hypothetical protein